MTEQLQRVEVYKLVTDPKTKEATVKVVNPLLYPEKVKNALVAVLVPYVNKVSGQPDPVVAYDHHEGEYEKSNTWLFLSTTLSQYRVRHVNPDGTPGADITMTMDE